MTPFDRWALALLLAFCLAAPWLDPGPSEEQALRDTAAAVAALEESP